MTHSYNRFRETLQSLRDSGPNILNFVSNDAYHVENQARIEMIGLMITALEKLGCDVDTNGMNEEEMVKFGTSEIKKGE